jgi:hypothetical protein
METSFYLSNRAIDANRAADAESWLGKFGQRDKWSFCLTAAMMAAHQERR